MHTFLERSPAFGKYSPIWHWCSGCKSDACHHIGTYETVRYRAAGNWVVYGVAYTFGAYRYHMQGRSCCEQCDYRHADCLVPSWMP